MNYSIGEVVTHCHIPNCSWLSLRNLTGLQNVPPLLPNPELAGIGVILGFSVSAYLTLALLILHYVTVHNVRRTNRRGKEYINPVDRGVLTFIREQVISWSPSKRFEYAMEKSVLILSDLNLVTGIGLLISAYSQLDCGISAYHWQIMVFMAWFASFSFVSAMAFLEGYFQTNNNLRIIRVFFMCVLASLLIAALLPTGSKRWLNQYVGDGDGFYPSLSTACYYRELSMSSFVRRGPKIWSMLFSVAVVAFSYIHCGMRLFDPTAETTRKYLRTWPGSKSKQILFALERKAFGTGLRAHLWHVPYLSLYAAFASFRAFYDISESMLLEIIWLTFAMAWGTIKVWETRATAAYNFDGISITINQEVHEENSWTFGQTLPLILLLLPLLSMAQAYLDNDAKAQEAKERAERAEDMAQDKGTSSSSRTVELGNRNSANGMDNRLSDLGNCTSCSATPRKHHPSLHQARTCSMFNNALGTDTLETTSQCSASDAALVFVPRHPYRHFTSHAWYCDHILLLLCQILMVTAFALWVLTAQANVFGISAILRNRLFLVWILAIVPLASMIHLGFWYIAALILCRWRGIEMWLKGEGKPASTEDAWWRRVTVGEMVYWTLRMGLVCGCLMFTLFLSLEIGGPNALEYGDEVTMDAP
ncbi:Nn.00g021620.m01.CDS01 [Neocucurbitaria sp. VM-36]